MNKAIKNIVPKNERHKFKFIDWENSEAKIAIYQCSECHQVVNSRTLYKAQFGQKCNPYIIRYDKT